MNSSGGSFELASSALPGLSQPKAFSPARLELPERLVPLTTLPPPASLSQSSIVNLLQASFFGQRMAQKSGRCDLRVDEYAA